MLASGNTIWSDEAQKESASAHGAKRIADRCPASISVLLTSFRIPS